MKIHIKKTIPPFCYKVGDCSKPFEIRKNDCDYKTGDLYINRYYDPVKKKYLGEVTFHKIGFLTDFEQKDGYVVFGLIAAESKEIDIMYRKMIKIEKLEEK